jgi:hypothetical protein
MVVAQWHHSSAKAKLWGMKALVCLCLCVCVCVHAWEKPVGAKLLELQVHGAQPKGARMLGKGQICKAAGVSTPIWRKTGGKSLWFSHGGAGPRGGLVPCVAKPMMGSPSGALTHHGRSPAVSKPSEGKAVNFFESLGALGSGEEA